MVHPSRPEFNVSKTIWMDLLYFVLRTDKRHMVFED